MTAPRPPDDGSSGLLPSEDAGLLVPASNDLELRDLTQSLESLALRLRTLNEAEEVDSDELFAAMEEADELTTMAQGWYSRSRTVWRAEEEEPEEEAEEEPEEEEPEEEEPEEKEEPDAPSDEPGSAEVVWIDADHRLALARGLLRERMETMEPLARAVEEAVRSAIAMRLAGPRRFGGGAMRGRLDPRRFASALAGGSAVFRSRSRRSVPDVDVALLVDESSSMCGTSIANARATALGLARAFRSMAGVRLSILGHTATFGENNDEGRPTLQSSTAHAGLPAETFPLPPHRRWRGGDVLKTILIRHAAPDDDAIEARCATLSGICGNHDGAAILEVARSMEECPARSKAIILIADGAPCRANELPGDGWDQIAAGVGFARRRGIDVFGIGIQTGAMAGEEARRAFAGRCIPFPSSDPMPIAGAVAGFLAPLLAEGAEAVSA